MMKIVNKLGVFIVIGCIVYLTYTAMNASSLSQSQGKELPVITNKMLNPEFLEPEAHASPADRDPFDGDADSGGNNNLKTDPNSANETKMSSDANNISFPEKLRGTLAGRDGRRLALIGSEVYGVGSQIKIGDSNSMVWQVVSIEDESVILSHNGVQEILRFSDEAKDSNEGEQKPDETPKTITKEEKK